MVCDANKSLFEETNRLQSFKVTISSMMLMLEMKGLKMIDRKSVV